MLVFFAALTFLCTFTTAAIAVVLAYTVFQRISRTSGSTSGGPLFASTSEDSGILKDESLSTINFVDRLLVKFDFVDRLKHLLLAADLNWSVGRVVMAMLLLGSLAMASLLAISWVPTWAMLLGALLVTFLPVFLIVRLRQRRLDRFEDQFPDALDSLCSALRAGHPLAAGISLLSLEYEEPLSSEMRRVFDERKLGMPLEQALENLAERIPVMDVGLFVAAVQLQTRTGGNLSEVLGRLSETMRESAALRGEVRSIAAHGKLTGLVLTLLPFAVVAVMLWVNPTYFDPLLLNPIGKNLIFAALVALIAAHLIIQRIVDIDI